MMTTMTMTTTTVTTAKNDGNDSDRYGNQFYDGTPIE